MDFNVEVRKKQLESLENFISTSYSKIQSVLDDLGWTESEVLKVVLLCNRIMSFCLKFL